MVKKKAGKLLRVWVEISHESFYGREGYRGVEKGEQTQRKKGC